MSTTGAQRIQCPACRHEQPVILVESANVERSPAWRERVIDGTFMSFPCGGCTMRIVVERELLYSDLPRGLFIGVFPRERRDRAGDCARLFEEAFRTTFIEQAPAPVQAISP